MLFFIRNYLRLFQNQPEFGTSSFDSWFMPPCIEIESFLSQNAVLSTGFGLKSKDIGVFYDRDLIGRLGFDKKEGI
jgi:hypothetical protein